MYTWVGEYSRAINCRRMHARKPRDVVGAANKKARDETPGPVQRLRMLFLVFFLGLGFHGGFSGLPGFGFFHGLASFFGLFGARLSAFLALFIEYLLAAEQFEECLVGAVTLLPS